MVDEPKYEASKLSEGGADTQQGMDAASQSLMNALRISFRILTVIILLLFIMLLIQGWKRVHPGTRVLVLRWGQADGSRVYGEGSHWAWFYPIDEVHAFEIKSRHLEINTFWPKTTEQAKKDVVEGKKKAEDEEVPVLDAGDGYVMTGDLNVLESRWAINYRLSEIPADIIKYYNKFGPDTVPMAAVGLTQRPGYMAANLLVKAALENAIVHESARFPVLDVIYGTQHAVLREAVAKSVVKMVQEMDCGIEIIPGSVKLQSIRPPKSVKNSFDAVKAAQVQVGTQIKNAQTERDKLLVAEAGAASGPLLGVAIEAWWDAKHKGDQAAMKKQETEINRLLDGAAGNVANIIRDAKAYGQRIVDEAMADAKQLEEWTEGNSPETVRVYAELYRIEAIQEVLANAEEVLWMDVQNEKGTSELEIIINRHPSVLEGKKKVVQTR